MRKLKTPSCDWKLVKHLCGQSNPVDLWGRTTGRPGKFKSALTKTLKITQNKRCAYCDSYLHEDFPHRDHIAPKEHFPEWTFRPDNLVLSCYACNTDRKKTYNPISQRRRKYKRSAFSIVHPYYDNPDNHFSFLGNDSGVVIVAKSLKGDATINLFDLASPERTKQRAKDALLDETSLPLHGKWRLLFENVVMSCAGIKLIPK